MSDLKLFPPELSAAFRPLKVLGAGAMGMVFAAQDLALDREVAVKVVQGGKDEQLRVRMGREAAALARIRHPNVVQVFSSGMVAQGPYMVMELLQGRTLTEHLPEGSDPLEVMLQIGEGLEAIHRAGMLHRDMKPDNLMLTVDGRAVILDFGLVLDPERTRLTATGNVLGTLVTLAPELLQGREMTVRSDWYAWGVSLFAIQERRYPFDHAQLMGMMAADDLVPVPWGPVRPRPELVRAVEACMDPDPARRPGSLAELRARIAGPAPSPRPGAARSGAHRPEPRSGATPGPHAAGAFRNRVVLAAGLAGGLALVALGPFGRGDPGGAEPGPPTVAEPEGPGEAPWPPGLSPALPERLRAELEAAAGEGALDPDPACFGKVLDRAPAISSLRAWIRAGGEARALPAVLQEAMADVDAGFAERGLARPFFPAAAVTPRPGPRPLPERVRAFLAEFDPPSQAEGWLAAAFEALEAGLAFEAARDRDLVEEKSLPDGVELAQLRVVNGFGALETRRLLEGIAPMAEVRAGIGAWAAPGVEALVTMLYAGSRSLAEEDATRDLAEPMLTMAAWRLRGFFLAGYWFVDPDRMPTVAPRTPEGRVLEARQLELAGRYLAKLGLERGRSLERELALWEEVLADPGGPAGAGHRLGEATAWTMEGLAENRGAAAVGAFYRRVAAGWDRMLPAYAAKALTHVIETLAWRGGESGLTGAERAAAVSALEARLEPLSESDRARARKALRGLAERAGS